MTDKRRVIRPRRRAGTGGLPLDLREWFAGERMNGTPWSAMIYPDCVLLRERWQVWLRQHPEARPPSGYEWIADAPPERLHGMSYADALKQARRCAARALK